VARLAHQLAIENSLVTADSIEVSEFPDLAQRYNVMGVPRTIINERVFIDGAVPESQFMARVLEAAGIQQA
jgi:predicted DsbA family dithiol-disulfide isomerase